MVKTCMLSSKLRERIIPISSAQKPADAEKQLRLV